MADCRIGVLLLLVVIQGAWTDIFTTNQVSDIDSFVRRLLECRKIAGMTVGIVKGEEIWSKGYGLANVENQTPVTSSTIFGIGSISKGFTTALLSILISDSNNKINWNSKLSDIFGEEIVFRDDIRTKETTLKDILSHRTGLVSGDIGVIAGYPYNFTRKASLKYLKYLDESVPFRDGFVYNNWMYTLAGYAVEVLSGRSWEEELQARILDPLGITSTKILGFNIEATDRSMAQPYILEGDQFVIPSADMYRINPQEPAGAIASSADDIIKWIQLLLNKGNTTDGRTVIDWKTFSQVFSPVTVVGPESLKEPTYPIADLNTGYGYGWFIGNHNGYHKVWHSGGLHAYTSMLWIFPDLKIGIFENVNGPPYSDFSSATAMSYFFDMVLGNAPWLNETTICTYPQPWAEPNTYLNNSGEITNTPIENPDFYTGNYGNQLYGEVQVSFDGSGLRLKTGRVEGYLNTTKKDADFRLQIYGEMNFLYNQGDIYHVFPVQFVSKNSDKFQKLTLELSGNQRLTFTRGVKFANDNNKETNVASKYIISHSLIVILLSFVIQLK